jgi:ferritin-like metal-binding protein YciE
MKTPTKNIGPSRDIAGFFAGVALSAVVLQATRHLLASGDLNGTGKRRSRRQDIVPSIDTFSDLYVAELQELREGSMRLGKLLPKIVGQVKFGALVAQINDYSRHIASAQHHLNGILEDLGTADRDHVDDGQEALGNEVMKMRDMCAPDEVRDAALAASLQRILHYRISTLGTVAEYARTLDRPSDANILQTLLNEEKSFDWTLSELAISELNPAAKSEFAS